MMAEGMLNSSLWTRNIINKSKRIIYKSIIKNVIVHRVGTWEMNVHQKGLLSTEMDCWYRAAINLNTFRRR